MAKAWGIVQFGFKVKLESSLIPGDLERAKGYSSVVEGMINTALLRAAEAGFGLMGIKFTIREAKTKVEIIQVEP